MIDPCRSHIRGPDPCGVDAYESELYLLGIRGLTSLHEMADPSRSPNNSWRGAKQKSDKYVPECLTLFV